MIKKFKIILFSIIILACIPAVLSAQLNRIEFQARKQTISALAFNRNDPGVISNDVAEVLFYGKAHPYGEILTEATVNSITTDMCEGYYRTWFKPNIAYLAIVGDMNLKEAQKMVKKYFGSWKAAEVTSYHYPDPSPPASPTVAIVDRPYAVQSVMACQQTTMPITLKPFHQS